MGHGGTTPNHSSARPRSPPHPLPRILLRTWLRGLTVKKSKAAAHYLAQSPRQPCETCDHWRNGSCTKVSGDISPTGTCSLYEKRPKPGAKR